MYALRYREELPPAVTKELDDFIAFLKHFLGTSLNEDGTLKLATPSGPGSSGNTTSITDIIEQEEGHWWKKGPWIFDTTHSHDAFLYPPTTPAGTYNDYSPGGIDTAIGIEFNPTGNFNLTGLKAPPGNYRRLLVLRNQSSTYTVTLKHQNTGSADLNRFALPGAVDIVMGTQQTAWLYYDADNRRWGSFITGNTAGGLSGAGGAASGGDVTGPAGAVDNNIAVFDGVTGKLIKDGGSTVASITSSIAMRTASVTISVAQMKLLLSTPIQLVVAPGAGKTIVPVYMHLRGVIGADEGGVSVSGTIRYKDASHTTAFGGASMIVAGLTNRTRTTLAGPSGMNVEDTTTDITNSGLEVIGSANAGATLVMTENFVYNIGYFITA